MSYLDKVRKEIIGGEPLGGSIRRFDLDRLEAIAEEADKEIVLLKSDRRIQNECIADQHDQIAELNKKLKSAKFLGDDSEEHF